MRFEQLVDAAVALLRRRRRVTLRLLQREYELDDQTLADLVHELQHGQRVALDAAGQVLEWRNPSSSAPAERRQLTVMFCDLVGSTKLAVALDPEDLREIVQRYQAECASVIEPLGGHIAQVLGDGLLVYFGHPRLHEDDAERAVRAGLAVVQAVQRLGAELAPRFGVELAVRVGAHSGLVVVGEVGAPGRRETLALGEAPNLAAHIQACARPNEVLVSEDTFKLLGQRFHAQAQQEQALKHGRPLRLLRIVAERDPHQGDGRGPRTAIDTQGHAERLCHAWAQAAGGASGAIALLGEAGLGKTRLVEELRGLARAGEAEAIVLRCSAFHRHSALHPFAEHLSRRAGLQADSPSDDVSDRLRALLAAAGLERAQALALMAALVAPACAPAQEVAALAPAALMQATQALLVDWLVAAAGRAPLLLVCEDLHWADASTLALLKRLLEAPLPPRTLLVLSARPDFTPPWGSIAQPETLTLRRWPVSAIAALVRQLASPRTLEPALLSRIAEAADGVPLYAEEIAKAVLETNAVAATQEVPTTLQASLLARLDRLDDARPVAQTAALLGREFSFELLASVVDLPAAPLGAALHRLVAADLLRRHGTPPQARYAFRHALLQTAAAESLLRSARTQLHRRIADALQSRFGALVEAEPETLARHLAEAGESLRAIPLWQRAGERALARSALVEAAAHLQAALDLLPAAGDGEARDRLELELQVLRASALRATEGIAAAATGAAYQRAAELARSLHRPARLIPALNGLYSYHMVRGECEAAGAPARELLEAAQTHADATFEMIGLRAVGAVAFHVGDAALARDHLQRSLAMYDPARHAGLAVTLGVDHKVTASNFLALSLFVLGERDSALALQREALTHADALQHAHSQAQALVFGCLLLALAEQWQELPTWAGRVIALGRERGFPLMEGGGRFFAGAAEAFGAGRMREGLAAMQQGAALWWGTGARNYRSYGELLMARAQVALGRRDEARALLRAARAGMEETGERWIEPALARAEAELERALTTPAAAS
jgi:predicted ATPase/class 3 adenylate cyclase